MKEKKWESSLGLCLSDQSFIKDIRVVLKLLRNANNHLKVFITYIFDKNTLKTLEEPSKFFWI